MSNNDDSPAVIGAVLDPMPTKAEAEAIWREAYAARLVERDLLDWDSARACAAAGDVDLSANPADAADSDVEYWDAD